MGLKLTPGKVTLPQLRRIAREAPALALAANCRAKVDAGAATVQAVLDRGETVYGLNTGFGAMARTRIDAKSLRELQRNLVLSHCTGTGEPLCTDEVVQLILALKVVALASGNSGVRWALVEALLALHNHAIWPVIPAKGSVGASGDLAPLAHLAAVLLGVGEVRCNGELLSAAEGLERAGLEPIELGPKEGLALLNGTQVSTALALRGLFAIEDAFAGTMVAGALSVDAALGSDEPFDSRIQALRGQSGQSAVAECYRGLLAGSKIRESHRDCNKVQDPYSLRCQPQVMGACLDQIVHAAGILEREANAVTDNPLVFP
ncbi:MAG: aromatic amino acid lyase, partial [Candidatus Poseidoniia archaeon]|nr:aromatic amino acid lyase [Candidatus Poseidoniia archaeon]